MHAYTTLKFPNIQYISAVAVGADPEAFKNRQHAAWPALFRKAHTDLEALGGITCPAEWRLRHSVADVLNKGVGSTPDLLLVR